MPMPTVLSVAGTATSSIWTPDWMQSPFSVSYVLTPNSTGTSLLQVTYDNLDVSSALGGLPSFTAGNATWVTVAGPVATNTTGVLTGAVRGIQINLITSSATGACTATLIQATFPR